MTDTTQPAAEATVETPVTTPAATEPNKSEEMPTTEATTPVDPAETTEEAAAPETDADPADEAKPKKSKGGFQNRIDELTRKNHEERLLREAAERKLAEVSKQQPGSLDAEPGPEPKLEEFTTVDAFLTARDEWAKRQGYQEAKKETVKQRQEQERATAIANLTAREEAARAKHADYDRTVQPISDIVWKTPAVAEYVLRSETGPELAYHLAKNPAVLLDLTRLDQFSATRELAKLEARLSAAPPPKPVTNAPAPIKPVGASEKAPFSLETADMDAFVKRRNEEERKARKG